MGEGPPHVVALVSPGFHQLLELGDDLVIASPAGVIHPQPVMDFLPSVQAQDHVIHFPVGKVDDVLVDEHPVGGEGEAEVLAVRLLLGAGVGHQILYHLPIHERLSTKEVHLQVPPGAGVGNEEIQSLLPHLKGHEGTVSMVLPLTGEAIGAVQVAGVGHMEAQGLHHVAGALLQLPGHGGKVVGGEQLSCLFQPLDVLQTLPEVVFRHIGLAGVLFQELIQDFLGGVGFI